MRHSYLEVTFRRGRPLAAYYYLPREDGDLGARTEHVGGLVIADPGLGKDLFCAACNRRKTFLDFVQAARIVNAT